MRWSTPFVAPRDAAKLIDVVRPHLGTVVRRDLGDLLRAGAVTVDGVPRGINDRVAAGAVLRVDLDALAALAAAGRTTPPSAVDLPVVHADDALVVVDKPAGMHVHPMGPHRDDTVLGTQLWRAGARPGHPWTALRPTPAHRLDRPTSGLLLFATSHDVQALLQTLLQDGAITRTYRATVEGRVAGDAGTIDAPLGPDPADHRRRAVVASGQSAITHWHVVGRDAATTTLQVTLGTGRTHQVRAHLASRGHPIVGDRQYGATTTRPPTAFGPAIALRATRLSLPHPRTGLSLDLRADDPDDPPTTTAGHGRGATDPGRG